LSFIDTFDQVVNALTDDLRDENLFIYRSHDARFVPGERLIEK